MSVNKYTFSISCHHFMIYYKITKDHRISKKSKIVYGIKSLVFFLAASIVKSSSFCEYFSDIFVFMKIILESSLRMLLYLHFYLCKQCS